MEQEKGGHTYARACFEKDCHTKTIPLSACAYARTIKGGQSEGEERSTQNNFLINACPHACFKTESHTNKSCTECTSASTRMYTREKNWKTEEKETRKATMTLLSGECARTHARTTHSCRGRPSNAYLRAGEYAHLGACTRG